MTAEVENPEKGLAPKWKFQMQGTWLVRNSQHPKF